MGCALRCISMCEVPCTNLFNRCPCACVWVPEEPADGAEDAANKLESCIWLSIREERPMIKDKFGVREFIKSVNHPVIVVQDGYTGDIIHNPAVAGSAKAAPAK